MPPKEKHAVCKTEGDRLDIYGMIGWNNVHLECLTDIEEDCYFVLFINDELVIGSPRFICYSGGNTLI